MPSIREIRTKIAAVAALVFIAMTVPLAFAERAGHCQSESIERDLMAQLHLMTRALSESASLLDEAQRVSDPLRSQQLELVATLRNSDVMLARLKILQRVREAQLLCEASL